MYYIYIIFIFYIIRNLQWMVRILTVQLINANELLYLK